MEFKACDYSPSEILKFIRQSSSKTQEELAKCIKKSKNWVKNNEQGLNRFYFEDLVQIANICDIDIIFKSKKKD